MCCARQDKELPLKDAEKGVAEVSLNVEAMSFGISPAEAQ